MKNRILPLILILFIIISPSTSLVTNVHAEQTTNSSCNLKILIQVAYNTTSDDPEQLYLFRGDLEAKLISNIGGREVGIIPTLREKLEGKGCSVHIDWQFDIGRPRHWWKPEYAENLPETNLISNYNIIIFLGHGNKHQINLTTLDPIPGEPGKKTSEVDFLSGHSHFRNKGWIIFISCYVLGSQPNDKYPPMVQLFMDKPIRNKDDITDLSTVYLLITVGFSNELVVGKYNLAETEHKLLLDKFLELLFTELIDKGKNLKDAWISASKQYAFYLGSEDVYKEPGPTVLYPTITIKFKNGTTKVYSPLSNIFSINSVKMPREVYLAYKNQETAEVRVNWFYKTYPTDIAGAAGTLYCGYNIYRKTPGGGGGIGGIILLVYYIKSILMR